MDVVVAASGLGSLAGPVVIVIVAVVLLFIGGKSILIIVPEYERAVFFRFGRILQGAKGPGIIVRIPAVDRVVKVNQRVEVVDIPPQAVISKDNVTIQVDAVVYFQVVDPVRAIIGVDNFRFASQRVAMTSLRSIIGRFELDGLLAHREDVNGELRTVIGQSTEIWGVQVRQVEVRDIQLPPELLRAMARQAEAERERRAKVIAATGELESSRELAEAADRLTASPGALQLRTLQTLAEVATERNTTLIFPIPIELFSMFRGDGPTVSPSSFAVSDDQSSPGPRKTRRAGAAKSAAPGTPELGPGTPGTPGSSGDGFPTGP